MTIPGKDTPGAPRGCKRAGFTLMEMLIVVAIAAILLFIALPTYRDAVLKSNRAAGKGALLDVMSRQEQYFINNKRYATSLDSLGLGSSYYIDRQSQATGPDSAVYRIELDILSSLYAGVRAIPLNAQAGDRACMSYAISRTGIRSVSGALASNPASCW